MGMDSAESRFALSYIMHNVFWIALVVVKDGKNIVALQVRGPEHAVKAWRGSEQVAATLTHALPKATRHSSMALPSGKKAGRRVFPLADCCCRCFISALFNTARTGFIGIL